MADEKKSTEETLASDINESESPEGGNEQDPILEVEKEATESLREESEELDSQGSEPEEELLEEDDLFLNPDEVEDELFLSPDDEGGEVVEITTVEEEEEDPREEELQELRGALASEQASHQQAREQVESLQGSVKTLEEEKEEINNRFLRSVADLENYRRRTEREKEELRKYGIEKAVADLVPAVDNMERALAHAKDQGESSSLVEGIGMVYRQILSALKKYGVQPFDSKGQPFDPQRHEAIQQVESAEHDTGTIVEEYQKGYFIHDRLLRPALVVVAIRVQPPQNEETESEKEAVVEAETEGGEEGNAPVEAPSEELAGEEESPRSDEDGGDQN